MVKMDSELFHAACDIMRTRDAQLAALGDDELMHYKGMQRPKGKDSVSDIVEREKLIKQARDRKEKGHHGPNEDDISRTRDMREQDRAVIKSIKRHGDYLDIAVADPAYGKNTLNLTVHIDDNVDINDPKEMDRLIKEAIKANSDSREYLKGYYGTFNDRAYNDHKRKVAEDKEWKQKKK